MTENQFPNNMNPAAKSRTQQAVEPHSLEYYKLRLAEYMISDFPDRMEDLGFVGNRAEMASETFDRAIRGGANVQESEYEANEVLFAGIKYSPFRLVRRVVSELFSMDDEGEEHLFAMQMLERCNGRIKMHDIQNETFPGSKEEDMLYTEIAGEISMYLKQNGME